MDYEFVTSVGYKGRSQKFVSEGDKTRGLGAEVAQRGTGAESWWGSGGS